MEFAGTQLAGAGGGGSGVHTVNNDPGPNVVLGAASVGADPAGAAAAAVGGHEAASPAHAASAISTTATALAGANVQAQLADAGSRVLALEANPWIAIAPVEPFVVASSPTYTTTWTVPGGGVLEGESWRVSYEAEFSAHNAGTGVVRLGLWRINVCVVRSVGSNASIAGTANTFTTGSFGSMGVQAFILFGTNELQIQIRFSGGATGRLEHRYRMNKQTPVPV